MSLKPDLNVLDLDFASIHSGAYREKIFHKILNVNVYAIRDHLLMVIVVIANSQARSHTK